MLVTLRQAGRECNAHNQCTTYERGFWIKPSRTVYTMAHSTREKERKSMYITWVKLSTLEMISQPFGFSRKSPYRGGARGWKSIYNIYNRLSPWMQLFIPLNTKCLTKCSNSTLSSLIPRAFYTLDGCLYLLRHKSLNRLSDTNVPD